MKSLDVLNLFLKHEHTLSSFLESRTSYYNSRRIFKECLVFERERSWTWQQFHQWAAQISQWLSSKGLEKGDKVAVIAKNSDFYVALLFAVADQGLVLVPVNPDLKTTERD